MILICCDSYYLICWFVDKTIATRILRSTYHAAGLVKEKLCTWSAISRLSSENRAMILISEFITHMLPIMEGVKKGDEATDVCRV